MVVLTKHGYSVVYENMSLLPVLTQPNNNYAMTVCMVNGTLQQSTETLSVWRSNGKLYRVASGVTEKKTSSDLL